MRSLRFQEGEQQVDRIVEAMLLILGSAPEVKVQYAEIVDQNQLEPLAFLSPAQDVLVAIAAFLGQTRLIDNVFVRTPAAPEPA
jgi:pantoate--beta-alanine ligase